MTLADALPRLLRPAGGGIHLVSTGKAEQDALQRRLYGASTDDEVRRRIAPLKCSTDEWLAVMRAAHGKGLKSTATRMFGVGEEARHRVAHLTRLRGPQDELDVWRSELDKLYDPHRMIVAVPSNAKALPPALASKKALGSTVAYVCRGMTCSPPMDSLGTLLRQLTRH